MRIPKSFLPDKDLEKKIEQLLKENKEIEKPSIVDEESEILFPNFVNYLKDECGPVTIQKNYHTDKMEKEWLVYLQSSHKHICRIKRYIKEENLTREHRYKVRLLTSKGYKKLVYRIGYDGYDSLGSIVFEDNPFRYDFEEDIPFP